jgi:hypothetical protein
MQNKKLREEVQDTKNYVSFLDQRDLNQHKAVAERLAYLGEVVAAVSAIVGADLVQAKVEEMRVARKVEAETKMKTGLAKLVEQGVLIPGETVTPSSFIVATQTTPQGIDRVQFEVAQLPPEAAAKYLGKAIGDEFVQGDVKLVITEVYGIDVSKAVENVKAANEPQAAAQ